MLTIRRLIGLDGPAGYVFAGRLLSLIAGVVTALVASRALGAGGRGTVVGFSAIQFLLSTGLALGTGSAAYLAVSRRDLDVRHVAGGVVVFAVGIALLSSVLILAMLSFGLLDEILRNLPSPAALLIGPAAAGQYLILTTVQVAMGSGRARATMIGLSIGPAVLLVATLIVAVAGATPLLMVVAYTAAWVIGALIATLLIAPRPLVQIDALRHLIRAGSPAALGDVANALSYRADVIVLGAIAGTSAVGVYSLAVQALEPLWLLAGSAAGGLLIVLPHQPQTSWTRLTLRGSVRVVIWTALGAGSVVALMPLLASLAGPGFSGAPLVALALAPAIVLLALSKMLAVVQLASGRLWWGTVIAWSAVAANVGACLLFIPWLGALGAALASIISYGLSAALWMFAFWRPDPFPRRASAGR